MDNEMDHQPDEDRDWPRPTYTWILTPLLIFTLIAIAATLIQLRRRRAARHLATAHARRVTGDPRRRAAAPAPGRARWWVGMRRRDEGVEGLDEYGEAPPPYEPAGAKKGDVEMGHVAGPPGYGEYYGDASAVPPPPAAVTRER